MKRLIGKPSKSGRFQIGPYSDFLREYLTLFPDAVNRLDRISFKPYRSNVITGLIDGWYFIPNKEFQTEVLDYWQSLHPEYTHILALMPLPAERLRLPEDRRLPSMWTAG